MDYGKYIIVNELGHFLPILFHQLISHDTFLKCYHKDNIRSAGFFRVDCEEVVAFGKSTTLNKTSHIDDGILIKYMLQEQWR